MPKTPADEGLSSSKIRKEYRRGKRQFVHKGVKFKIRRGGPDNNYLMVSPVEWNGGPVMNFPYDEQKHDDMMERRRTKLQTGKPKRSYKE